MSKTFKDSRTFRELAKPTQTAQPSKAAIQAYKRKRLKEQYRLEPTWKSGIEHRLGADN